MQTLTEKLILSYPPFGIFDKTTITNLFPGSSTESKKLLLHRAKSKGEIISIKRGLYCLDSKFRKSTIHPFALAPIIHSPSYVSLESALWYHGLIPEALYGTSCITGLRSRSYNTTLGHFQYYRIECQNLKAGVRAVELGEDSWGFVAGSLRAIADMVYLHKEINWRKNGKDFLLGSMRIGEDDLLKIDFDNYEDIHNSMENNRVRKYLSGLRKEFGP